MKRDEACMIIEGMIKRLLPSMDDKREALQMALDIIRNADKIYQEGVRDGKKIALNALYGECSALIMGKRKKVEKKDDLDT